MCLPKVSLPLAGPNGPAEIPGEGHENPFVRYRHFLYPYRLAAERFGCSDERWTEIVEDIDAKLVGIDGVGFRETPLRWSEEHQVKRKQKFRVVSHLRDPNGNPYRCCDERACLIVRVVGRGS